MAHKRMSKSNPKAKRAKENSPVLDEIFEAVQKERNSLTGWPEATDNFTMSKDYGGLSRKDWIGPKVEDVKFTEVPFRHRPGSETALQRALRSRQTAPNPDQWFTTTKFARETNQSRDAARRELETFPGIKRQMFRGDLYWSFEDDKPGTTAPSE